MKNNLNESGRSMIEMLGVLAIIGVLSVGGIAGYSKAMTRYRINKAIEQITLIAGNVRTFFKGDYTDLVSSDTGRSILKKAKIVPDEMWDGMTIYNVFNKDTYLNRGQKSKSNDYKAFILEYRLPDDEEICIELVSQDWSNVGIKGIMLSGTAGDMRFLSVPTSLENAISKCSESMEHVDSYGIIYLNFYFDVNDNCWSETNGNTCS